MIAVTVYLGFLSLIGLWRLKKQQTFENFFLSTQKLGMLETSLTLMSTWVDSAIILGFSGYCYMFGYDTLWIAIPTSVGVYTFSLFFAAKVNRIRRGFTIGGVIEEAYGTGVSVVSSLFTLLYSITLVATNVMAAGYVMQVMVGVPFVVGAFLILGVAVLYTVVGGFKKVVETDIAQFFLLIVGLGVLLLFVLKAVGGFGHIQRMAFRYPTAFSVGDVASFFIVFTFPFWANPSFYQRCNAAKSPDVAVVGVATVGLVDSVMTFVALIVGIAGVIILGRDVIPDAVFPGVVKAVLPWGLRDFVGLAILSAIMSTADSYLLIAGGVIAHDILKPIKREVIDELVYTRVGIVLSAAVALFAAMIFKNILDAAMFAFSLFVSSNLIPLVVAFYVKDAKRFVAPSLVSMLGGGLTVVLWKIFDWGDVSLSVMYGLLVSGILWLLLYGYKRVVKGRRLYG